MVALKDIPITDGAAFFRRLATLHRETADHLDAHGLPDLALVERGLAADFEERAERLARPPEGVEERGSSVILVARP